LIALGLGLGPVLEGSVLTLAMRKEKII